MNALFVNILHVGLYIDIVCGSKKYIIMWFKADTYIKKVYTEKYDERYGIPKQEKKRFFFI